MCMKVLNDYYFKMEGIYSTINQICGWNSLESSSWKAREEGLASYKDFMAFLENKTT